jgi:hypothetical protein
MTNNITQLNIFQRKVFDEYKIIKSFRMSENKINNNNKEKGCLAFPFGFLADIFVGKIIQSETRKRNLNDNLLKAKSFLQRKEVIDEICETFSMIPNQAILTEEKFVNKLTELFFHTPLANHLSLPEDAVLYAVMAIEIFEVGIENFCNTYKNKDRI